MTKEIVNIRYTPQCLHYRLRAVLFQNANHHFYVYQTHRIFDLNLSSVSNLKNQCNDIKTKTLPKNNNSYLKNISKHKIVIHDEKFMNDFICLNQMVKKCAIK